MLFALVVAFFAIVPRLVKHFGKGNKLPVFDGVAPGIIPADPTNHPTTLVRSKELLPDPPPPRFNPPERILPWMTGDLFPRGIGGRDVGALLVDLAVSGYVRIDQLPASGRRPSASSANWMLVRTTKSHDHMQGAPREMLSFVFPQGQPGDATSMDTVRGRARSGIAQILNEAMRRDSMAAIGTHANAPDAVRTALRAQVMQFHQYLKTAEAGSIKVDEAAGIFSRYLPWAIALGEAEHWAKVFKDVAASAGFDSSVTTTDVAVASLWANDLAWFGSIDFGGLAGGFDGFDGIGGFGDAMGSFSDGIGDFGSSMDGFVSDFGGHSSCGGSSCSSASSCSSGSSCGGSSCGGGGCGGGGCGGGS